MRHAQHFGDDPRITVGMDRQSIGAVWRESLTRVALLQARPIIHCSVMPELNSLIAPSMEGKASEKSAMLVSSCETFC